MSKPLLGRRRRKAIDTLKIEHELSWWPAEIFKTCIRKTVQWYLGKAE